MRMPERSWTPAFTPKRTKINVTDDNGEKATPVVAYFPTWKGGFRNELLRHYFHLDMARLLEADPTVETWTTDVDAIHLAGEAADRGFTPAFRVVGKTSVRYLHLVAAPVKSLARNRRHRALQEQCEAQGMSFEVLTRKEIEEHPRLKTSRDVLFYRTFESPPELPAKVTGIMAGPAAPQTLGVLHSTLGGSFTLWQQIVSLVGKGHIEVDMGTPIGPNTSVVSASLVGYLT